VGTPARRLAFLLVQDPHDRAEWRGFKPEWATAAGRRGPLPTRDFGPAAAGLLSQTSGSKEQPPT
jgi:hypothetical protein